MGSKIAFKAYSLSTTVREVDRVPDLMYTIKRLEDKNQNYIGDSRDKKRKENYVAEIIRDGFITSNKVEKSIIDKIDLNEILTDDEVEKFMSQAHQKPGWAGRLSNYLNKVEPLGFAYRTDDHFVVTTKLGRFYIEHPIEALIWSLVHIPANNPFKRNLNSFTLLGNVALYLKKYNKTRISREDMALLISVHDYKDIDGMSFTGDKVGDVLKLSPDLSKNTIFTDYVDEVERLFIAAGLFAKAHEGIVANEYTISNLDKFISDSIKSIEMFKKIKTKDGMINLINNTEYIEYFKEADTFDNITKIKRKSAMYTNDELVSFVNKIIRNEQLTIEGLNPSIKRFVLFEWVIALMLAKIDETIVNPNLSLNSDGFPISQAGAGKPDLEVQINGELLTVEVTLITNRQQMLNSETTNLIRHMEKVGSDSLLFIAPVIHDDVSRYFKFEESQSNKKITAITVHEFIEKYIRN